MSLRVVPAYAALMALMFVALSFNVIRLRRARQVAVGIGGYVDLERRVRVHANFAEYAPFSLLLLALAELRGVEPVLLHPLCLLLLGGRLAHAWGVSHSPENFRFRVGGMVATLTAIAATAVLLLVT